MSKLGDFQKEYGVDLKKDLSQNIPGKDLLGTVPVAPREKFSYKPNPDGIFAGGTDPEKYVPGTLSEARDIQKRDKSLWEKISRNLMKPVGTVATLAEQTGIAIGEGSVKPLLDTPKKIGGIWSGTQQRSFSDIWKEHGEGLGLPSQVSFTVGLLTDLVADPLNVVGGGLTKAGKLASKVQSLTEAGRVIAKDSKLSKEIARLGFTAEDLVLAKTKAQQAELGQRALIQLTLGNYNVPIIKGKTMYETFDKTGKALRDTRAMQVVNKIFSTKTSDEAFNTTLQHFNNLKEYREGKVMTEAVELQKAVGKLTAQDAYKIVDIIETGNKTGNKALDEIAMRLKRNFKEMSLSEKRLGLRATDIQNYFPHIKVKKDDGIISSIMSSPRKWDTALGASKERKITGTVKEINDAFGTDFFEKRPAIAFAQRALGSTKAVTSAEFFKTLPNFVSESGRTLSDATLKKIKNVGVELPDGAKFANDVADQIERYATKIAPEELNAFIKSFDYVQNLWKAQALVAPAYHIRNLVGNNWNNYLAGVKNPVHYADALRLQMGKNVKITDDAGKVWNTAELVDEAQKTGVLGKGWFAADIPTALQDEIGSKSWNPLKQNFGLYKANRATGEVMENNARLAHFIDRIKKGFSPEDAAKSVKKYLFDYNDLTGIEQNAFKRLMPFYTWTRKNIPLQLETLVKDPSKFADVAKTQNAIESRVDTPDERWLSTYIKDNVGIKVRVNSKGNTEYFLLGTWLPSAQAIDFLSQPVDNFVMMLSPFIKTPVELWANKSTFFKNALGEYSQIERYPEENISWLGLTMRKKTAQVLRNIRVLNELDRLNPGEIFGTTKKPSLAGKLFPDASIRLPGVGTITASGRRGGRHTPDTTQGDRVLQSLFGKLIPYDPALSRQFYMWDVDTKVRNLERAVKKARRDGQATYAKELYKQLIEAKRLKGGPPEYRQKPKKKVKNDKLETLKYFPSAFVEESIKTGAGVAKGIAQAPIRVGLSLYEIPRVAIGKDAGDGLDVPLLGQTTSYQKQAQELTKEYNPLIASLRAGGESILGVTTTATLVQGAVDFLAKNSIPPNATAQVVTKKVAEGATPKAGVVYKWSGGPKIGTEATNTFGKGQYLAFDKESSKMFGNKLEAFKLPKDLKLMDATKNLGKTSSGGITDFSTTYSKIYKSFLKNAHKGEGIMDYLSRTKGIDGIKFLSDDGMSVWIALKKGVKLTP